MENQTMSTDISAIGQPKPAAPAVVAKPPPMVAKAPATAALAHEPDEAPAPEVKAPKFEPMVSSEEMRENLREAVKRLNDMMREGNRDLNFSMDEVTDRVVITVKNANTGEVVRQIPDATLMRMAHNLENLKGVLHNESI
jgi:flagellar protein FlaG